MKIQLTREKGKKRKGGRCEECGYKVVPSRYLTEPVVCPRHWSAGLIEWPHEYVYAQHYLEGAGAKGGKDLERWIETATEDEITNVSRGALAIVLSYLRKWDLLEERELPTLGATPMGLYG
ncbi:MAG: hypothetical protein H0U59_11010 [Gemmatimonadaceae bacterium]|nr:hypothetical protein [Gemmatimonadaceae bacterium]